MNEFELLLCYFWHSFNLIRTFSSFEREYIKFPLPNDLFWTGSKLPGEHNLLPWGDLYLRTDYAVVDDEIGKWDQVERLMSPIIAITFREKSTWLALHCT